MNIISWEQLQNMANNMLKVTDNPHELLMIYINKMYSILLDAPPELHPYMIQGLRDTGMFEDPVLTMFFNQLLSGEVDDAIQPDILKENMRMIEVNGGHIRSKLNKRKNMTAGNPKNSASGTTDDPEKVFTVEENEQPKKEMEKDWRSYQAEWFEERERRRQEELEELQGNCGKSQEMRNRLIMVQQELLRNHRRLEEERLKAEAEATRKAEEDKKKKLDKGEKKLRSYREYLKHILNMTLQQVYQFQRDLKW